MRTDKRPVFLHLWQIQLPLTGWISILHRLTGLLLFLFLPLPLYLWQHSLQSETGFAQVSEWLAAWPLRLLVWLLIWWFAHHLFAGVRFLLIDVDLGVSLRSARWSASAVLVAELLVVIWAGWLL
jgi:succinate dehydrogenase / fumarate reductase cytochrome b subunit